MGIKLLTAFFILGACMSGLAAVTLFQPGTMLDRIWAINPQGHAAMLGARPAAIVGMAVLSATMTLTAAGLFRRRLWAWWTAVAVLGTNAIGDLAAAFAQRSPRTLIGLPIVAGILWWMTRARPRFR